MAGLVPAIFISDTAEEETFVPVQGRKKQQTT